MNVSMEVAEAIGEIEIAYPEGGVNWSPDGQGGAYVTIASIHIGPKYVPEHTWIKFHITFQYPNADVYPHFVRPDLSRADGGPLGDGLQPGINDFENTIACQVSRRSNRLDPATDTALLKLIKVVSFIESRP